MINIYIFVVFFDILLFLVVDDKEMYVDFFFYVIFNINGIVI